MSMTLEEITSALTVDTRPMGPDGASNVDRIAFICDVLELETIDLTIPYEFTGIIAVEDPAEICAAKHLALLQLDYYNRLFDHGHLSSGEHAALASPLMLAVLRIDHHLSYVEAGQPTPPFSVF